MYKKLIYMAGKPYWYLPEGGMLEAEQKNGRIVDPVVFRKKEPAAYDRAAQWSIK